MDAQLKKAKGRKRNLIIASTLFAIAAIGYGAWWALVLRHQETTDDAYVAGHLMQLTPEISGTVTAVRADDTDRVSAGQTLVELDGNDTRLAFERARSDFIDAVRQTRQLMDNGQREAAQTALREAELAKAKSDLARRSTLAGTDAISTEELAHAKDAVAAASAALDAAREQRKATAALIGGDSVATHPAVLRAAARLKEAWLANERTRIKAPASGFVSRRSVQAGQHIAAGSPLMAIVPLESVWVDANFKEVQLAHIRIGQPVTLTADQYGSKVSYHGKVAGLSAGTGSAFSLLPAQNATGNWIKVVQRLPVRIELDPAELKTHPLRVGLSMAVEIDTRDQNGKTLADGTSPRSAQVSATANRDLAPVDAMIAKLLAENGAGKAQ
ncbi:HlyD family secretion protein [Paludibacterium paludis]|nr:efflux RND transporter periplasmic adaptor subunit [Paludibacterium paludis]